MHGARSPRTARVRRACPRGLADGGGGCAKDRAARSRREDEARELYARLLERLEANDFRGLRGFEDWRVRHPRRTFSIGAASSSRTSRAIASASGRGQKRDGAELPSAKRLLDEVAELAPLDAVAYGPQVTSRGPAREICSSLPTTSRHCKPRRWPRRSRGRRSRRSAARPGWAIKPRQFGSCAPRSRRCGGSYFGARIEAVRQKTTTNVGRRDGNKEEVVLAAALGVRRSTHAAAPSATSAAPANPIAETEARVLPSISATRGIKRLRILVAHEVRAAALAQLARRVGGVDTVAHGNPPRVRPSTPSPRRAIWFEGRAAGLAGAVRATSPGPTTGDAVSGASDTASAVVCPLGEVDFERRLAMARSLCAHPVRSWIERNVVVARQRAS